MKVIVATPPMYGEILRVFPAASAPGSKITRELHLHEEVHVERQGSDPWAWWRNYLSDPEFRLAEELPAHRAEYHGYCKRHASGRAKMLGLIASRLSGPLYGGLLSYVNAELAVVCRRAVAEAA